MSKLQGSFRFVVATIILATGCVFVVLASLIPFNIRRVKPSIWVIGRFAAMFPVIFNVKISVDNMERLRNHEGIIFMNHNSYLEAILLFSLIPVRFLVAIQMATRPFIGPMAKAVDTVFVARENRESREQARNEIEQVIKRSAYPSMVIFPEGRLGLGGRTLPFRRGGFDIAVRYEVPYIAVAAELDPFDIAAWKGAEGETLLQSLWKIACYRGEVRVNYTIMDTVYPTVNDDALELAREAELAIADALVWQPSELPEEERIAA